MKPTPYPFWIIVMVLGLGMALVNTITYGQIKTGDAQTSQYLPLLKGKRIGLVVNSGSRIGKTYLVDSLIELGIVIKKIFAPEHGFRSTTDAGQVFTNFIDSITGVPVVSLYGKHLMPDSLDMADIDLMVFDLQDVGVRFYTYISTLHYIMKACAQGSKPLVVLDRPNPNGSFVDGPILDSLLHSFVGMHRVPILYGMTIGEYAKMIQGENWIGEKNPLRLWVIPLIHYRHDSRFSLPYPPSPNLPNNLSVALYPSLCLFEGTAISIGRGTPFPFQVFGSPDLALGNFTFTPHSIPGKSAHPPLENKLCRGLDLRQMQPLSRSQPRGLSLGWLIWAHAHYTGKEPFFNGYFKKLAGTDQLQLQIEKGLSEKEIRLSWYSGLEKFKNLRKKYLLYP